MLFHLFIYPSFVFCSPVRCIVFFFHLEIFIFVMSTEDYLEKEKKNKILISDNQTNLFPFTQYSNCMEEWPAYKFFFL